MNINILIKAPRSLVASPLRSSKISTCTVVALYHSNHCRSELQVHLYTPPPSSGSPCGLGVPFHPSAGYSVT